MARETDVLDDALARASMGDEAGFLHLWRTLQPRLLRFLRVIGCDDADDVASETWLQVVRDLHKFSGGEEDFRRWLFTIGRHRAVDAARARSRRPVSPMMTSSLDVLADHQLVEDQVLDDLSVQGAVALLASLPPDQAEAVALRILAGLDTSDVARILGKSAGAVRVALHRGLKTLARNPSVLALAGRGTAGADGTALPDLATALEPMRELSAGPPASRTGPEPTFRPLKEVDS